MLKNLTCLLTTTEQLPIYVCPSDSTPPMTGHRNFDGEFGTGSYAGCAGSELRTNNTAIKYINNGVFNYENQISIAEISDGTSNTFFVGETVAGDTPNQENIWALGERFSSSLRATEAPLNLPIGVVTPEGDRFGGMVNFTNGAFGSEHSGGGNFTFGDAHTNFVNENIDQAIYEALGSRNLGEVVDSSSF